MSFSVCSYVTDVEGNLDYFERFVELSQIVDWADHDKTRLKFTRDDAILVFGGDSQDKGIGDIRFTNLLLNFKKEYPDRVEFLIGNRDANKIRLSTELHPDCLQDEQVLTDKQFPYWLEEDKRVTPQMYLDETKGDNTPANRLRWMLKETMGADGALDRRRHELAILRDCPILDVTDDQVVESYRNEVDPNQDEQTAFMLTYLKQAKMALLFGQNVFVHGAVSERNMGRVPGVSEPYKTVPEWVQALNEWTRQQIEEYTSDPYTGKNGKDRKGFALMDYGVPGGNDGATVIYDHNLDNGNGKPIAQEVQDFLKKSGIKNAISGHTPHGDCPMVIRTGDTMVLSADTSYSDVGHESPWGVDNRGCAVSEVLVYKDGRVQVHGILADGSRIAYKLRGEDGDAFIGKEAEHEYWVKAKTAPISETDSPEYVLCHGEGHKIDTQRRPEVEMHLRNVADLASRLQ